MGLSSQILQLLCILAWKILQPVVDTILAIIFRGENDAIVPIREDCLLDSSKNIAARIRTRKITCEEVVEACIRRIHDINGTTNCVVENRFEAALEDARAIDKFIDSGSKSVEEIERETPLLGVPFTTKDGIPIKDVTFACGVVARKDIVAEQDAEAVKLLRGAGAIPLATTNVPELSSWWESDNRLYGRTRNPYHSQTFPGGSSGGEAALLAAAGSFFGLGSDIGGSVRIPATFCGIFAHKPSEGVVSERGRVPSSEGKTINVVGPMAKSAVDLPFILNVLDSNKKLKLDKAVDLKKIKIYYMEDDGNSTFLSTVDPVDDRIKKAIHAVAEHFNKTHGVKAERVAFPQMKNSIDMWWAKLNTESSGLLASQKSLLGIAFEFIKCIVGLSEHTFETPLVWFLQGNQPKVGSKRHTELLKMNEQLESDFKKRLGDDGVFLYPTSSTPALRHGSTISHANNFAYTAVFNAIKMPATQCPVSQTEEGLPIGIQVVTTPYNDHLSLAVAREIEKAFGGWKPPPSKPKW